MSEEKKNKKMSHYTTISHFTQTLYLDYRHYVPIKHKRKVWHFKLFRESAYCLSGKKTKGKIKIYYHLLKILLKINKTNTNKTQQKSPTLSLSLYISPSIALCSLAGRLSEEEEAERTHLHINCERQGLSSAAH